MSTWYVISPRYYYIDSILEDGSGPAEPVHDVVEVEATTMKAALIEGVRAMRADSTCKWMRDYAGNPFAGLRAVRVDEEA